MSSPTPVQSFLGGIGLSLPVFYLRLLNANSFGVSGFLHRAAKGQAEPFVSVFGILLGGVMVGFWEENRPQVLQVSPSRLLLSGFLVGVGSRMANGCTSGHMLAGICRLSKRSFAATLIFSIAGVITTHLVHADKLPIAGAVSWSLGADINTLFVLQAVPLSLLVVLYCLSQRLDPVKEEHYTTRRHLTAFLTGFDFAVALHMSNLTESSRVLSFLALPPHHAFDPSLAFLALGALPLGILLYRVGHRHDAPCFGEDLTVESAKMDARLILGSTLFGIGWGLCGICRKYIPLLHVVIDWSYCLLAGPAIVNLGRALAGSADASKFTNWLAAVTVGGLLVGP